MTYRLIDLDPRAYNKLVKETLRDDDAWLALVTPQLIDKTRTTLLKMIVSIDTQIEGYNGGDTQWLKNINRLRHYAKTRLDAMPPVAVSGNQETKAWQGFCERLATALRDNDTGAIDRLRTPYGGLTARQWLNKRQEKRS